MEYPPEWQEDVFEIPGLDTGIFNEGNINQIFDEFDPDGKEFLTRADIRRMMNIIGEMVTEGEIDEIMRLLDPQGTGIATREQFSDAFLHPSPLFQNPYIEPNPASGTHPALPVRRARAGDVLDDDLGGELQRAAEERRMLYAEIMATGKIKSADIKRIFARLQQLDTRDRGTVTYPDFLIAMQRDDSESSQRLFDLCDKDGTGEIDLREFILGLSQLTEATREDRLKFAFKLYDKDNSGYVDRDELTSILKSSAPSGALPQWISKRVGELYASIDLEPGSLIDLETFLKLAEKNPTLIAPAID
jgi:serine/threonine-protein phosphatase 2B regulatory subunit